jgi:hypothetical protein
MAVARAQQLCRVAFLAVLAVFTLAPAVYAHGQFDPAEMGAPIATSAFLGVASFWLVRLWPAAKPARNGKGEKGITRDRRVLGRRRRSRAKISLVE